jgi:Xaa-Pro dipeptidase
MHLDRLNRLRAALAQAKLDCVAIVAGPNLYYLTGLSYHLSERPTTGFFPAHGDPVIVAGNLEASKTHSAPYPVKGCFYTDADGPVSAYREAANVLRLGGRGGGVARLGVETRRMRVMELRLIEDAFLNPRIDAAEEIFAALRMAKDELELNLMRRAVEIAEAALRATLPTIRVGQTEREIGAELLVQTLRAGSDAELPFAPIVASGPNSALPHASMSDRAIQRGDLLTLDWGAAHGGYAADLTRTYAIGEINDEFKTIYELVKNANAAAQAAARPGAVAAEVDAAARRVITAGGYGEYFVHRLGHGLGLEGHEDPSMHGKNELSLTKGITFTVEPGIYLPGKGGVRIEDNVVVTANGCESLSTLPRDLEVIGV